MTNKTPNKTKTPVGGLILGSDPIEFNAGRKTITLKVRNTGDRLLRSHCMVLLSVEAVVAAPE